MASYWQVVAKILRSPKSVSARLTSKQKNPSDRLVILVGSGKQLSGLHEYLEQPSATWRWVKGGIFISGKPRGTHKGDIQLIGVAENLLNMGFFNCWSQQKQP